MRASIIQIGNSRGVRIPKVFLDQAGLHDDVEIEIEGGKIVVRAAENSRTGWDEAFRRMREAGDDQLLDAGSGSLTTWDETEWEW